jgi:hypothetical protein
VTLSEQLRVEWIEVVPEITHTYRGDLEIVLTSPAGTQSVLAEEHRDSGDDYSQWTFTSARHWGETSQGDWTLTVRDLDALNEGTFDGWELRVYGAGEETVPPGGFHTVAVAAGQVVHSVNFGNRSLSDVTPPTVLAVEVNADLPDPANLPRGPQLTSWHQQRSDLGSIVVTFSEPVELTPADLRLTNLGVNAPVEVDDVVPPNLYYLSLIGSRLTIMPAPYELDNGVYQLEILPSVTDTAGNPLDGDGNGLPGGTHVFSGNSANRFYKMTGDFRGGSASADGGVSILDWTVFAYWFGVEDAPVPGYVDMERDGVVNILDWPFFLANFGNSVVFPPAGGETSHSADRSPNAKPTIDRSPRYPDTDLTGLAADVARTGKHESDGFDRRKAVDDVLAAVWYEDAT